MKKFSFLTRVSLLLGFFFTLDKLLAFACTIIILRQFQLSSQLDAFYFADLLPSWEVAIFSGSALAMAMIPVSDSNPDIARARIGMEFILTRCQPCIYRDRYRCRAGCDFCRTDHSLVDRTRCQRGRTAFHREPDAH